MPTRLHDERKPVVSEIMKNNDTWNECPECGYTWKSPVSIPGVIHNFKACAECRHAMYRRFD